MKEKRVAIVTLGCKVNQYDSAALAGVFQKRGYRVVDSGEPADVCVVNTCSVTQVSDKKSRQLIRRTARAHPEAVLAVTGCYAQGAPEQVSALPGVDLVVGVRERQRLVELVEGVTKNGGTLQTVGNLTGKFPFDADEAAVWPERNRAFLKIQDGCDNYCTYCIVPYVRGGLRSLPPEQVEARARELVAAGYNEIVLTGIHAGSYGRDLPERPMLAGLLRRLAAVPGMPRLRLGSVQPNDLTLELVEMLSGSRLFCRHLHIPLQSGDDAVLEKMGRRYTAWEYTSLINVLKENIPGLGLTTDVIVGFPGETEASFERTYNLVRKCSFSKLHVFKYSPRSGTPAASFAGQVPEPVKEERSRKLITLGHKMAAEFAASLEGQVLDVLVEGPAPGENGIFAGLTDNYLRAFFPARNPAPGSLVPVKMARATFRG